MIQMNLFMKQTHRSREELMVTRGEGWREGIVREFGTDIYTLLYLKRKTNRTYCIAQGTLLNVTWQPGWAESLGENGYMYMCGRVTLLCI